MSQEALLSHTWGTFESRPWTQKEDGLALWGAKPAQKMAQDPTNSPCLKADGNGYERVWRWPARSEAASWVPLPPSGLSSSSHRLKDKPTAFPLCCCLHTLLCWEPRLLFLQPRGTQALQSLLPCCSKRHWQAPFTIKRLYYQSLQRAQGIKPWGKFELPQNRYNCGPSCYSICSPPASKWFNKAPLYSRIQEPVTFKKEGRKKEREKGKKRHTGLKTCFFLVKDNKKKQKSHHVPGPQMK